MKYIIPIILIIAISGCSTNTGITSSEDISVMIVKEKLPENYGFVLKNTSIVGTKTEKDYMISRALYKFDVSEIKNDFVLYVKCLEKSGNPGSLEVYNIKNFNSDVEKGDVSELWKLKLTGTKFSEVTPVEGQWFEIFVPRKLVEGETFSVMFKVMNEDIYSNNFYSLSYEKDKPYIK